MIIIGKYTPNRLEKKYKQDTVCTQPKDTKKKKRSIFRCCILVERNLQYNLQYNKYANYPQFYYLKNITQEIS